MNKSRYKLFFTGMEKIIILWYWYQSIYIYNSAFTEADITHNFTKTESDSF